MDNYTNAALNGYGISMQSLLSKRVVKGSAAAARKMAYLRSLRKGGRRKITGMKSMRKKKGGFLGTLLLGTLGAVGIHKLNQLLKQKQGGGFLDAYVNATPEQRKRAINNIKKFIDNRPLPW